MQQYISWASWASQLTAAVRIALQIKANNPASEFLLFCHVLSPVILILWKYSFDSIPCLFSQYFNPNLHRFCTLPLSLMSFFGHICPSPKLTSHLIEFLFFANISTHPLNFCHFHYHLLKREKEVYFLHHIEFVPREHIHAFISRESWSSILFLSCHSCAYWKMFLIFCRLVNLDPFLLLMQTLGIQHAFSSFIWLCGPITGLVVGNF